MRITERQLRRIIREEVKAKKPVKKSQREEMAILRGEDPELGGFGPEPFPVEGPNDAEDEHPSTVAAATKMMEILKKLFSELKLAGTDDPEEPFNEASLGDAANNIVLSIITLIEARGYDLASEQFP